MKAADLHKTRHGRLIVYHKLSFRDKYGHVLWLCQCDCGGQKIAQTGDLTTGRVKSCGCMRHRKGKESPTWKRVERRCAFCGKKLNVYPCHAKKYEMSFCGNECKGKWRAENLTGKNGSRWKPKAKVACPICGHIRKVQPSRAISKNVVTCGNKKCRSLNLSLKRSGRKNPNYHGGSPIQRKLGKRVSVGIRKALKFKKDGYSWELMLGYTRKQLFDRLSSTMPVGYTWDDLDKLHIDHIVPKSAFNYESYFDADFKRCWALKNLRLLPADENMKKGAMLEHHFQPQLKLQLMQGSGKTINNELTQ